MATAKKKSSGGARAGQKKRAPAKKRAPRRRLSPMVQALICFALAVVTLLSLLPLEGFVLSWCFLGLSALLGPGVYLVPFCLLGAGGLLVFRGRDKHALRLAAVLLLPLLLGPTATCRWGRAWAGPGACRGSLSPPGRSWPAAGCWAGCWPWSWPRPSPRWGR